MSCTPAVELSSRMICQQQHTPCAADSIIKLAVLLSSNMCDGSCSQGAACRADVGARHATGRQRQPLSSVEQCEHTNIKGDGASRIQTLTTELW